MRKPKKGKGKRLDVSQLPGLYAAHAIDPGTLRRKLPKLRVTFDRLGKLDLLLDLLLAEGSIGLDEVDLVLEVYLLADGLGRKHDVTRRILERRGAGELVAPPWTFDFKLGRMVQLGGAAAGLIVQLKYDGVTADPADPFAAARAIGRRILFPRGLLDALFAVSRFTALGRDRWEEEVRTAFALEHLTSDFQTRRTDLIDFPDLLDRDGIARALAPLAGQPLLCLIFHGGYLALAKRLFVDGLPGGMRMQLAPMRGPDEISVRDDVRAALFRALDALRSGRALMVAPDAGIGALRARIPVLGHEVPAAEGTAFLAHETGCRSVWFAVERDGDGFAIRAVDGPRAEPDEAFAAFRKRFFDFIGARIEETLTGDPRNLVFRLPWATVPFPPRPPGDVEAGRTRRLRRARPSYGDLTSGGAPASCDRRNRD